MALTNAFSPSRLELNPVTTIALLLPFYFDIKLLKNTICALSIIQILPQVVTVRASVLAAADEEEEDELLAAPP